MQKTYFNYISNIVALLWILAIWFASSDNSLHLKWTPLWQMWPLFDPRVTVWKIRNFCTLTYFYLMKSIFTQIWASILVTKDYFFQMYTSITCKIFVTKDKFVIYVNNSNYIGRCGSFYVCILHALKWLHNSFMLIIFF